MKIGIIGCGHVGLVTAACFAQKGNSVFCVDNDEQRVNMLRAGRMPFYEPGLEEMILANIRNRRIVFSTRIKDAVNTCEALFISVSTPSMPSGALDLSAVEHVSREIAVNMRSYKLIVEKSTVPVRTCDKVHQTIKKYVPKGVSFDVASNPEFLREGSAIYDSMNPDRIVIGVSSRRAEGILKRIYKPFKARIITTDIKSAELIKHASNSFLAMKISFINAVANVCELADANIDEVAYGIGMDNRIGHAFLKAGAGYGGSCFPKDVSGFIAIADSLGYNFGILKEVQKTNLLQRQYMVRKIESELWIVSNKTIGILGLAFKPDTDDIREAPALDVIRMLLEKGAKIKAYDPKAMESVRKIFPDITYCRNAYEVADKADCVAVLTEWKEFAGMNLKKLKKIMAHPTIIDGRNIFDPVKIRKAGFTYHSVGRP